MRLRTSSAGFIVIAAALALGGLAHACHHATTGGLSDDARLALEVGCIGHEGRAAGACRRRLERLYVAGTLDPDRTLRAYCEAVEHGRWGGSRPPPPPLCVERYGGWPGA